VSAKQLQRLQCSILPLVRIHGSAATPGSEISPS